MSAWYLFDNRSVKDADLLAIYKDRAAPVVAQYGGRYVVLGGPAEPVEGDLKLAFPVMIEFDDADAARRWYDSPEYADLKALRLRAVDSSAVLLNGL